MNDLFESEEITITELLRRIEALEAIVIKCKQPLRTAKPFSVPEHLRIAWARWDAYRRTGKRWTADAKKLNLSTLDKLACDSVAADAIVARSIENGWTGLFALKDQDKPAPSVVQTKTVKQAMAPSETPLERALGYAQQRYERDEFGTGMDGKRVYEAERAKIRREYA